MRRAELPRRRTLAKRTSIRTAPAAWELTAAKERLTGAPVGSLYQCAAASRAAFARRRRLLCRGEQWLNTRVGHGWRHIGFA